MHFPCCNLQRHFGTMSGKGSPKNRKPAFKKGASSDNPDRLKDKKDVNKRDKTTINRLRMYKNGAPVRNKHGKVIGGTLMSKDRTGDKPMATMARIAPDRRWFGNTRVIAPQALDKFREDLGAKVRVGACGGRAGCLCCFNFGRAVTGSDRSRQSCTHTRAQLSARPCFVHAQKIVLRLQWLACHALPTGAV